MFHFSNIKTSKVSIVGYGLLSHPSSRLLINTLKDTNFGVVIVDESHYMKNRKAARTKALITVIKKARRAVLLTGTPALARPEEVRNVVLPSTEFAATKKRLINLQSVSKSDAVSIWFLDEILKY